MAESIGNITQSSDSKARILRAAVDLFAHKGFDATSVREVAAAAGVTKPTLYYHFGSKDGLGLAVIRSSVVLIEAYVSKWTQGCRSARERLVAFVEAHFAGVRENESLATFLYSVTFSPKEMKPQFDVDQVHRGVHSALDVILEEAIAEGMLPAQRQTEANLLLTGIINIYLMGFLHHGLVLDHDRAELAVTYFLDGIRA